MLAIPWKRSSRPKEVVKLCSPSSSTSTMERRVMKAAATLSKQCVHACVRCACVSACVWWGGGLGSVTRVYDLYHGQPSTARLGKKVEKLKRSKGFSSVC